VNPKHIENARIAATFLGFEDHGILTLQLICEGASTQGFGGYALDGRPGKDGERVPIAACGAWIAGLLRALKVDSWERVKGQLVRVERDEPYGQITRIGHIIEDRWFSPADALAATGQAVTA
jgi:hypothetical protein